jgi:hypothetical protein
VLIFQFHRKSLFFQTAALGGSFLCRSVRAGQRKPLDAGQPRAEINAKLLYQ